MQHRILDFQRISERWATLILAAIDFIYIYNQVHGNKSAQRNEIAGKTINWFFTTEYLVMSICVNQMTIYLNP